MQGVHGVRCRLQFLSDPTGRIRNFLRSLPSFTLFKRARFRCIKNSKKFLFNNFTGLINMIFFPKNLKSLNIFKNDIQKTFSF